MHCSQCGRPIKSPVAVFCSYCGSRIQSQSDDLDKTVSVAASHNKGTEYAGHSEIVLNVPTEASDEKTAGTSYSQKKETHSTAPKNDSFINKSTDSFQMSEDESDATVRTPFRHRESNETERPIKKLDNDISFEMPEPEEEDVFETTAQDNVFTGAYGINKTQMPDRQKPSENSSYDFHSAEGQTGGVSVENPYASSDATVAAGSRRYPPQPAVAPPEVSYPSYDEASYRVASAGYRTDGYPDGASGGFYNAKPVHGAVTQQKVQHEVFTQPGSGTDNFFVQQAPDYSKSVKKNKIKPGMLVLIIVIAVVLFIIAVAGGIFVATIILNNACINGTGGIIWAAKDIIRSLPAVF